MLFTKLRRSALVRNILLFMAILGPGIITGSVDNDAGGITTYSVVGASYGYNLIWTLIPAFIVLVVVQEMNARMGLVTGKGLADLIRENAGVKLTFVIFSLLLVGDIFNTASEFAGVAGAMNIFGVSKYVVVPVVAVAIWFLVVKGTYSIAEKVFLAFSAALLAYVVAALMGHPKWNEIGQAIIRPHMRMDFGTVAIIIGLIGTTIAPWMQFYMQSSIIDKGLKAKDYKFTLIDIIVGCTATIGVAFFIIVACANTLHVQNIEIKNAADAAIAMQSITGLESAGIASIIFACGLTVASIFASVILPVAVSFYVCEAFGFEAGLDKTWKEAPIFYWLYTIIIAVGAGLILLVPDSSLIQLTLWSQRINGIMLPVVLLLMMIIINKKEVMGEHVNNPMQNIIGWTTITILVGLSLVMLVTSLMPAKA